MNFQEQFQRWLQAVLSGAVPREVKAFAFNLYELPTKDMTPFGVELIGSPSFDPDNSDWACDEVWEADPRRFDIPIEFASQSWEVCLEKTIHLVRVALETPVTGQVLKSRQAVGVGFVDGDLEVVWTKASS